jgi:hypothetical protein
MKKIVTFLCVVLLIFSCVPQSNVPNVNIQDVSNCEKACVTLTQLNCDESKPIELEVKCTTPADCLPMQSCVLGHCNVTCLSFCAYTQNAGVDLGLTCVASIRTCEQIESCQP